MKLELHSNQLDIEFNYYDRVNNIRSEQGRGKSKLINSLYKALIAYRNNSTDIKSNIDLRKIDVIREDRLIDNDFKKWESGGFILFIDNYDRYYCDELRSFVKNSKNTFFLIQRRYGLEYQQQMRAENILDYDGKTYRLINLMCDGVEYHQRLSYKCGIIQTEGKRQTLHKHKGGSHMAKNVRNQKYNLHKKEKLYEDYVC